jgi:hypothetical protein
MVGFSSENKCHVYYIVEKLNIFGFIRQVMGLIFIVRNCSELKLMQLLNELSRS